MFDWSIATRADAHCEELLRTAWEKRLSHLGHAGPEHGRRLFCHVLVWVGGRLLAGGAQLQRRYGVTTDPALLRS